MLIDNFRIISQVEWRKQDSQLKILKSRYFRSQNVKMAKNIHESRGQTMPVRRLDAGTM
jgi:hypothetical protein